MADNPVFVHNEDVPHIDEDDYDNEQLRYDTLWAYLVFVVGAVAAWVYTQTRSNN